MEGNVLCLLPTATSPTAALWMRSVWTGTGLCHQRPGRWRWDGTQCLALDLWLAVRNPWWYAQSHQVKHLSCTVSSNTTVTHPIHCHYQHIPPDEILLKAVRKGQRTSRSGCNLPKGFIDLNKYQWVTILCRLEPGNQDNPDRWHDCAQLVPLNSCWVRVDRGSVGRQADPRRRDHDD